MSDPNLNDDAIEPRGNAAEMVDDELDIVEGADEQDEFEAAEAEAGEPHEEAAVNVEDEEGEAADEEAPRRLRPPRRSRPRPSTPSRPCARNCATCPASGTSSTPTPVTRTA